MSDERAFQRGDQVAYVPNHAAGDLSHADVEFGFVTSVCSDTVFCRYWSKYAVGELRTKANSEGADARNIVHHTSRPQAAIDAAMEDYGI